MNKGEPLTAAQVAEIAGGELHGDAGLVVTGVASLENAAHDKVCFLGNPKFKRAALDSAAGVMIVAEALPADRAQVVVAEPYTAFIKVLEHFRVQDTIEPGAHPTAFIDPGAKVSPAAAVGPLASVGAGAVIGDGVTIGAGSVIGRGCVVGDGSTIHPRVTLYPGTEVGKRVVIHAGCVIGADGFGYVLTGEGHIKKPQVGTVLIEDDVEMGANCCVDRAMLDKTVVGAGTKLDNMVHLAHNVRVGKRCIILAGTVVAGSVTIGDGAVISGNVTVKDNVDIGAGAMVVGHSGVSDDVPAGEVVFGYPAIPFSQAKRVYSRLKQLPDLFKRVRKLEKRSGD